MDNRRPRSREKNVTGSGTSVHKRGDGLHSGPVGDSGARPGGNAAPNQSGGTRSTGTRAGGGMKLILAIAAVLLLGGGGGLGMLLSGQSGGNAPSQSTQQVQTQSGSDGTSSSSLASILGGLGGNSVSSGWQWENNTGRLNSNVASGAREKYSALTMLGGGRDTFTIMVYMCGTDLESRYVMGTSDLQEMLAAKFGDNINLLVYTGGCTAWKNNVISSSSNQIWQVKDGNLVCLERNQGSVSMTDPSTLSGYINYCVRKFPASRYGLILWDHGGGSISGYGYDEKFASSGSMGLAGIHQALTDAQTQFDFIGFDACLMATAENALMLTSHADYLIASEETEPGVGWYYTDWLTDLSANPSMPTIELGKKIADSFVETCAEKCRGQLTTLSVIDLAELEHTLPERLTAFSRSASELIQSQQYQTISTARGNTREFAQSSAIDHVDLVHLARNIGTEEANDLADTLLSAVKYNRTSSNMTNAYGISIYFPYQKTASVDSAVAAYRQIGMDEDYTRCIQEFASLEVSGQVVSGGTSSPLPSLLGTLGGSTGGSAEMISQLLGGFLGGDFSSIAGLSGSNTGFLSGKALDLEETAEYLARNRFASENLVWNQSEDGTPVIQLEEEQWGLVQSLDLNLFYDDGEGYIDLGLDNVFQFDEAGGLLGVNDGTWLAIEGQPVAYYHTVTVDDGTAYTITGRVPVLHNGQRSELLLTFDDEQPYGYISGIRPVYGEEETQTVAKNETILQPGDTLEFLCDYYSYDGDYLDSYLLGEPLTVPEGALTISDVVLEGVTRATYRFTDIYQQHYWTPVIP